MIMKRSVYSPYLVFSQGGVKLVAPIGRQAHEVIPVDRQLVHLVLDVWSGKVLRGN